MIETLTRNAVDVLPKGALEEKLKLGRPLRVKLGIDVTSPDLHVGRGIPLQRMRAFQDAIFGQDRPVLESQRPRRLPLDPRAELHCAADRASAAYRRHLRATGIAFGTC